MPEALTDPRPDFFAAADWVGHLVRGVRSEQMERPTPCAGWTVRDLLAHCVLVARMAATRASGEAMVPVPEDVPADGWASLYDQAGADMRAALADPAVLARTVVTPHGELACDAFLRRFVGEFLVHGWDLAVATDQPNEGPTDVVERALAIAEQTHSAEGRNSRVFAPVAEASPDAGPTRRLAAWMGR